MANPTPGPWEANGSWENIKRVRRFAVTTPDLTEFIGSFPLRANAALIAAAPELLEALEAYQAANRIHQDEEAALFERAEIAIAKARGEVSS